MGYQVAIRILVLSRGKSRKVGARIGDYELPSILMNEMVNDGIVAVVHEDLTLIAGVSWKKAEAMNDLGLYTYIQVAEASVELLCTIHGINEVSAQHIKERALALVEGTA